METKTISYIIKQNGVTSTTTIELKPPSEDRPRATTLNIDLDSPTPETIEIYITVEGIPNTHLLVEFIRDLAHQIGHSTENRCIATELAQQAIDSALMEMKIDQTIEQILSQSED